MKTQLWTHFKKEEYQLRTSRSGHLTWNFSQLIQQRKIHLKSKKLWTLSLRSQLLHQLSILTNKVLISTITTIITAMFLSRIVSCTRTKRLYSRAISARLCAVKCVRVCTKDTPKPFSKINSSRRITVMLNKHRKKPYNRWELSILPETYSSTKTRWYQEQEKMNQKAPRPKNTHVKTQFFWTSNRTDKSNNLNQTFKYMLELRISAKKESRSNWSRTFWTRINHIRTQ